MKLLASTKLQKKSVAQQLRYLPVSSPFSINQTPFDPYPGLFRMLQDNVLLESVFVLVSSPATSAHTDILSAIKDLFSECLNSQAGILFLMSNPDAINGIHRALLQADDSREDSSEDSINHCLGMQIVCHLHALQFIDVLLSYHGRGGPKKEIDDSDAVSALHHLYTMTFIPIGRMTVINMLSAEHNLDALLPFVQMTGSEEFDTKLAKSVCSGYATELLLLVVHCSERVTMIENFAEALINLSAQEATPKLHELSLWMAPTKKISGYTYEAVGHLMNHIKKYSENAATLPPDLITALRILQYVTIPPYISAKTKGENEELKYKYAIIQVFSNDGLSCFLTILQKICDSFLKYSNQSVALVGLQGVLVIAIIKPVIMLLQFMLQYLIFCRGAEFKDLTAVPILLRVHLLMSLIPMSSFAYTVAQQVQSDIIETLLAYTQPYIGSSESEEALSKSLWTKMIQEVLKFLLQSPNTFITGLSVFSELLPLPLPLQTREPLSPEEVTRAVNCRKLWSAHLHSLSGTIQEIIISLSASSCHPLQQLLRRVCVQLSDLATPTAVIVVRAMLDALVDSFAPIMITEEKTDTSIQGISSQWEVKACSTSIARILNLLAYLVSHSPFKIPLINILKGSVKTDEKYADILNIILSHLNFVSSKQSHVHSQECIVSILQSLCDPDIGFVTLEGGASVSDVLANSLPPKEHISEISGALIQHIGNHHHTFASVLPSLRTLVMLTEHDYGFYYVRQALIQYPSTLCSLFARLSATFSKDSSDCLSTLSTTLEFLRLMIHGFEETTQPVPARTLVLSPPELSKILEWNKSFNEKNTSSSDLNKRSHPLFELEQLLTECSTDEEALESLLESVTGFIQMLSKVKESKVDKDIPEPTLPSADSQSAQFAVRPVYIVGEIDEERLSPSYWLAVPGAEETDQEVEQIPIDLISLSEKYWPDFHLKEDLEKLCVSNESDSDAKSKKKSSNGLGKRKYHPIVNPSNVESNNPSKKPFIAPMRGRGFGRGNSHSSRANDPFRSRPPNTSRPPSMHVDDFVALEHHHHHQSPSSASSTPKRSTKEPSRSRGRGFDSGRSFGSARGTSRFFSPPGSYNRRDTNRTDHFTTGNIRGMTRGTTSAWGRTSGTTTKTQNSNVRSFGRGKYYANYKTPIYSHTDRQPFQRNRDYNSSNLINTTGRFSRGTHGATGSNQGHWGDTRNKPQDGRFGSTNSSTRGRRENQSRHARSFTR